MFRCTDIQREEGFSLIELLVAVAILSLAAVTLLEHQTQAIGITSAVERRALASIVAENRMAIALGHTAAPQPGTQTGIEEQMGVAFQWRQVVRASADGDLAVVLISVSEGAEAQQLASLTGFRKVD